MSETNLEQELERVRSWALDVEAVASRLAREALAALETGDVASARSRLRDLAHADREVSPKDIRVVAIGSGPSVAVTAPWAVHLLAQSLGRDIVSNPDLNHVTYRLNSPDPDANGEPVRFEVRVQRVGRVSPVEQRAQAIAEARRLRLAVELFRVGASAWAEEALGGGASSEKVRHWRSVLIECEAVRKTADDLLAPSTPRPQAAPPPGTGCVLGEDGRVRCLDCGDEVRAPENAPATVLSSMLEAFALAHARCAEIVEED